MLIRIGLFLLGTLAMLFFFGFGIFNSTPMPGYAFVLVNRIDRTYVSPPCLLRQYREPEGFLAVTVGYDLMPLTAAQAGQRKFRPQRRCRISGAFVRGGRSLSGRLLQRIGILRPLPGRWSRDGGWKW